MTICPSPECDTTCECDACLDEHLRQAHDTTYGERFGPAPSTWLGLCPRHEGLPVQRMGAVESGTVGA